jgi:hypothetical protein
LRSRRTSMTMTPWSFVWEPQSVIESLRPPDGSSVQR